MKKISKILSSAFILTSIATFSYFANAFEKNSPIFSSTGWIVNGDKNDYESGYDKNIKFDGKQSIYIKSKTNKVKSDFSTALQSISAQKYLGKRVRFSGYIKSENAENVSLWMRIDGKDDKSLQFDNMENRFVKGTTDWKKYDVVLDIPNDSNSIFLGGFLAGAGTAWFDKFNIEIVDNTVPSTNMIKKHGKNSTKKYKNSFENMNFES